jgi:hypothetical protein
LNESSGLYEHLPTEDPHSLLDLDIEKPGFPTGHDILIAVKATGL